MPYQELTREIRAAERAVLQNQLASSALPGTFIGVLIRLGSLIGGISCCGLIVLAMLGWNVNPILVAAIVVPVSFIAIAFLYIAIVVVEARISQSRWRRKFDRETAPQIRAALEYGIVHVKLIDATAAIEIGAFDDEGDGYIFDVGDGRVFLMRDQSFLPIDEAMPWPCSSFEIVWSVQPRLWIGIFCSGSALTPMRIVEPSDDLENANSESYEVLLDANFQELAISEDFGKSWRQLVGDIKDN